MEVQVTLIIPGESSKTVKADMAASLDKMKSDILAVRHQLGKAEEYDLYILPKEIDRSRPLQNYKPGEGDTLYLVKTMDLQGPSIKGI